MSILRTSTETLVFGGGVSVSLTCLFQNPPNGTRIYQVEHCFDFLSGWRLLDDPSAALQLYGYAPFESPTFVNLSWVGSQLTRRSHTSPVPKPALAYEVPRGPFELPNGQQRVATIRLLSAYLFAVYFPL